MTSGHALTWAQTYMRRMDGKEVTSYIQFEAELKGYFESKVEDKDAIKKLINSSLGNRTCEDFFAEFDLLRQQAGWTSREFDKILIEILEEGFPDRLVRDVQTIRPRVTTYEGWRQEALDFDGSYQRRRKRAGTTPENTKKVTQYQPASRPLPQVPRALPTPPATAPVRPMQPRPVPVQYPAGMGPMDTSRTETRSCYNCGIRGHLASRCPQPKRPRENQVRQLDFNNLSEEDVRFTIAQWQAQKKAKEAQPQNNLSIANLDVATLSEADRTLLAHKLGFS
jgi:hypothetical protein